MTCKYIHQNFLIMLIYSYMLKVIFFLEKNPNEAIHGGAVVGTVAS